MNFFAELKRRHMFRAAAAYAVVAWVLLQLVNNLTPALRLPEWAATLVVVLIVVGFPITLLFCWIQHLPADGAAPRTRTNRLDWILVSGLAAVALLIGYQQLAPNVATTVQQQTGVEATKAAANSTVGAISIAVLPFVNLSSDKEQEFFSDGMTEEITSALAKIKDLRVVGRTSAFEFKGQNKDLRAIGQALGASHLIEGSVRKAGDRVRITAQLIKSDDGTHLWTENYDRELTDIFATQEDIAQAIAAELKVPLGLQQGETLVSNRTNNLESYEQYLRARAFVRTRSINEAIAVLEPVVARNPDYAPALALLSVAYTLVPIYEVAVWSGPVEDARRSVQSAYSKAEMTAREAVRLDPRHAGGYAALGYVLANQKNWVAAEDHFRQALALDPNDPDALHLYALMLMSAVHLKQAMSIREKLRTLEPFVPIYSIYSATIVQLNGQYEATIPMIQSITPSGPTSYFRNLYLAKAYAGAGRYAEAADTLLAISANQNFVSRRSLEDAARLLRGAPAKTRAPEALPVLERDLNFVYAYIGASDRIWESVRRSLDINLPIATVPLLLWETSSSPMRRTERFRTFVRDLGLVDYWKARGWPDFCHPTTGDDFECN